MKALAHAKVNLVFLLGRPRPDGYHDVLSLIEPLSLGDEIAMTESPGGADEVVCPGVEGDNLALAALRAFRAGFGWQGPPQRVEIAKRVPVAAGMGGGSADAAAVLRLAARASGLPLDNPVHVRRLREIAARLGADVPSLLHGGPTLGTGTGTEVEPVPPPAPHGVLVLPDAAGLSTPAVYREADRLGLARDAGELACRRAELAGRPLTPRDVVNDLQDAARSLHPPIDAALAEARDAGADVALVSGSGPTVVGLFFGADGPARAAGAAGALRRRNGPAPIAATPIAAAVS